MSGPEAVVWAVGALIGWAALTAAIGALHHLTRRWLTRR